MDSPRQSYDFVSIGLHWLIGAGIALVWLAETARELFEKGSYARDVLRSIHEPAGTVILLLVLLRLLWRLTHNPPELPGEMRPWERMMAHWTHIALYLGMAAVPLLGVLAAFARGRPLDLGVLQIASLFVGGLARPTRHLIKELHEFAANALIAVAFAHAAAALWHHYIRKDGVMSRMLPWHGPAGT
jgi:cytochrome b561